MMKIFRALHIYFLLIALLVCCAILRVMILFDPLLLRLEQRSGHKCEMKIK